MDVFHVFEIVQMVPNHTKHHIFKQQLKQDNRFLALKFLKKKNILVKSLNENT